MRRTVTILTAIISSAIVAVMVFPPSTYLLWNRTESAPQGLYWRSDGPLEPYRWAVVSGKAPAAIWISNHGYLAPDWPIIKRVRGVLGDEVCRQNERISINGIAMATALKIDSMGRDLPEWQGCFVISDDEIFLLNDHPRSLDGRYFGVTHLDDVTGAARLLIRWE